MIPHWHDCCTCIKFRKQCDGVQEQSEEHPWDGTNGSCSYWMGKLCDGCRHKSMVNDTRMHAIVCAKGTYINPDGQCNGFAPKVNQTTLEGF